VKLSNRLIVSFISSFLFSLFIALIFRSPTNEQLEPSPFSFFFTFSELFIISIKILTTVYILLGIPWSFLIDHLTKNKSKSPLNGYLFKVVVYTTGGFLISIILSLLYLDESGFHVEWDIVLSFMAIGGLNALLFYHISIVFDVGLQIYLRKRRYNIHKIKG